MKKYYEHTCHWTLNNGVIKKQDSGLEKSVLYWDTSKAVKAEGQNYDSKTLNFLKKLMISKTK